MPEPTPTLPLPEIAPEGLPPDNPDRLAAILRLCGPWVLSSLAGLSGPVGALAASVGHLVPVLVEQAAAAVEQLPGETVDAGILELGRLLVIALSDDGVPFEDVDATPPGAFSPWPPAHNED